MICSSPPQLDTGSYPAYLARSWGPPPSPPLPLETAYRYWLTRWHRLRVIPSFLSHLFDIHTGCNSNVLLVLGLSCHPFPTDSIVSMSVDKEKITPFCVHADCRFSGGDVSMCRSSEPSYSSLSHGWRLGIHVLPHSIVYILSIFFYYMHSILINLYFSSVVLSLVVFEVLDCRLIVISHIPISNQSCTMDASKSLSFSSA